MLTRRLWWLAFAGLASIILCLPRQKAQAIPSFARQTNMACNVCHYLFPELRPFGRTFKLNGYTLTGIQTITTPGAANQTPLTLLSQLPFSAMLQASYTRLNKAIPGTRNDNVVFPQELSFFIAGEITPRLGTFIQVTYDDESAKFNWDMTDIRYARHVTPFSSDLIYGLTLNNAPTVQDVWNTTPVWSFPWVNSEAAPGPIAGTEIGETLAQQVTGLGAYGFLANLLYLEGDVYVPSPQGLSHPLPDTLSLIHGVAPYGRLALQHQFGPHYLEVGGLVMYSRFNIPTATETDRFTDVGADLQYELGLGPGSLVAHGSYIHEKQDFKGSFPLGLVPLSTGKLNTFKADASYYLDRGLGVVAGYFSITGDSLFNSDLGALGKPDTQGIIAELDYHPWQNTKFALQYTAYTKLNGISNTVSGGGRKASDNNALFLLAWIAF